MKNKTFRSAFFYSALAVFFLFAHSLPAASLQDAVVTFENHSVMIRMRDGVRLNTEIYAPVQASEALPLILLRTPYGIEGRFDRNRRSYLKELVDDGYIFVYQDIRGRYKSDGRFVMLRPVRDKTDPKAVDEASDTYDTIEWLLKNVPNNNGRAGIMGISYGGWLAAMAIIDPHPALKAASPQAPPADMYIGDDFHHNGAFRLSYGFEYVVRMESSKTQSYFDFDRYDTYEWYLNLGPLSNATEKLMLGRLPTWQDFVDHPNYDDFWQRQSFKPKFDKLTVPTLNVAGWWDQEDFYGPLQIYKLLEEKDPDEINYFVAGPWNHGGWREEGRTLGDIDFGSATGLYFREKVQAPFFAYFLKDKGSGDFAEAHTFRSGENAWVSYENWPPKRNVMMRNLYFRANGSLSFDQPQKDAEEQFDSYVSDPANPVPYRKRPIEPTYYPKGSGWKVWQVEDQRFVHHRPDVLSWETETLQEDVVVSGDIAAHLFASTSGSDSDWIVKLIDVFPEDFPDDYKMGGYQLMVAGDVLRARYRNSFENPEPVEPDKIEEYAIDLRGHDHAFKKGHKIMVQVQSTWFPVIDRNPQNYVANIFKACAADFQLATQRVFRSKSRPSHIRLPVIAEQN